MERKKLYTCADELQDKLKLSKEETAQLNKILEKYPLSVPDYYLSLIDPSDPNDPIRKMCIPCVKELDNEGVWDTSGESDNTVVLGVQHKYPATALILSTNQCAMYCRHCFRKRMVGATEAEINKSLFDAIDYISKHSEVSNILISGGDALMLPNQTIRRYLQVFTSLKHLDFIRFGTRIPVVMPDRVIKDAELQAILSQYSARKQLILVTQYNHPKEITAESAECIRIFREMGIIVRNQTVLLRGVNDSPKTLGTLLRDLTAIGVMPYYVFQCRPVKGVKNQFQVPLEEGCRIVDEAKEMQNGQGKCFRYCMSLPQGKVEVLGSHPDGSMLFKFHQAKDAKNRSRIFSLRLEPGQSWIDLSE